MTIISEGKAERLKVFVPKARHLTNEEILSIPAESREQAGANEEGVWLEIECPDRDCVIGEGKIALQVTCARDKESEGIWMKLFCPEDKCFAQQSSDIVS